MPSSSASDQPAYDWDYLCKFILIGDSSVGKSSLLLRATDDRFLAEEAEPTVGVEFGSVTLPLTPPPEHATSSGSSDAARSGPSSPSSSSSATRSPNVKIQIWDTSGSEAFRGITRSYYRGAAGCLLVYDVTHRPSFTNAKSWLKDVREHAEEDAVVVLVGNRIDLAEDDGERRRVKSEEAKEWAESEGILFVETSAKTGHNVRHAFEACVREIHKRFVASQGSASSSSSESNKLLKSRTGGKGRGSDGQIRLDQDGGIMTRSGCCTVM